MSRRGGKGWVVGGIAVVLLGAASVAVAQKASPAPPPPPTPSSAAAPKTTQVRVLEALQADPVTAPFAYSTTLKDGKIVLKGRVSTKVVHDAAIRIATAVTPAISDGLVIDTAEAYRAAAAANPNPAPAPVMTGWINSPRAGALPTRNVFLNSAGVPYAYPPPLFGYFDDPFYGFEPPLISYPVWWGDMSARRLESLPAKGQPAAAAAAPVQDPASELPEGTIEMVIDPLGVAVLRGTVPTLADSIAIGQRLAKTPGVTEVRNRLTVREGQPAQGAKNGGRDVPPPPPRPEVPRARAEPPEDEDAGAIQVDRSPLAAQVAENFTRRPALAALAIRVTVAGGVAYLSGRVPTAYEAMLAFRAAQQTPGINSVDDRLEFRVPDGEGKNPLLDKGRPEDVEPYLESQIRRQLGDAAHVDRVSQRGDTLEVRGTLARAGDGPRIEAVLRSMPLLRGFKVEPTFLAE